MDWDSIRGVLASVFIIGWLVFMFTRRPGRRRPASAEDRLDIPLRGPETWWEPARDGLGFDPGSLVRLGPMALSLDARLAALARRAAVAKLSVRWRDVEVILAPGMPEEVRRSAEEEATRIARALDQAPRALGDVVTLALEHVDVPSNGGAYRAAVLAAIAQGRRRQRRVNEALERARSDADPLVALAAARVLGDLELERALAERLRAREGTLALADEGAGGALALADDEPAREPPRDEGAPARSHEESTTSR
ncbi:MAG: hypothetical protein IT385_29055 [Deltaproteobacteria bacterium]|nr:hypothetical protein [Deltaproteobacteria bacterium]